ncbi:MAG: hypothetical protein IJZ95_07385 [Oscillospiraceae bacterium]|nr:hypothetical protein [Oscillospiraceae bacterium]
MLIMKNTIDPPSEQRNAINKIEYLKDKITSGKIRRNEICKELKKLRRKLNKAQREYNERFGG